MKIDIPGYRTLDLRYLLLDYNGTLAVDGKISDPIRQRLEALCEHLQIHVLTADTHGTARSDCQGLPLQVQTFPGDNGMLEKLKIVDSLGREHCAAIWNGRNDTWMLQASGLSIAVMEREGMYGRLFTEADVCVHRIEDALDLLCYPKRLIATLRG